MFQISGPYTYIWTSGFTLTPGTDKSGWMWNMTSHVTPLTYSSAWYSGEPNNNNINNEGKIMLQFYGDAAGYQFIDLSLDLSSDGWFQAQTIHYVCEYNP